MSLRSPVIIENDFQYKEKLNECFQEYNKWADNFVTEELSFALSSSGRKELQPDWLSEKAEIEAIERDILEATNDYYSGRIYEAQSKVNDIMEKLISSDELDFIVSDIDCSYSTRLAAPFPALYHPIIDNSKEYERMNTVPLFFFPSALGFPN